LVPHRNYLPDWPAAMRDWKSAFLGTLCRASACADAPGRRRPTAGQRPMAGDFSRHVGNCPPSAPGLINTLMLFVRSQARSASGVPFWAFWTPLRFAPARAHSARGASWLTMSVFVRALTPCAACFFPEVFGALWGITPACPSPLPPLPAAAVRRGEGGVEKGLRRATSSPASNPSFSPPSPPRFGEEKGAGGMRRGQKRLATNPSVEVAHDIIDKPCL
jgi:hypothetical protein